MSQAHAMSDDQVRRLPPAVASSCSSLELPANAYVNSSY
jgi:hypothetical protein